MRAVIMAGGVRTRLKSFLDGLFKSMVKLI
jgi:NDP-sugar pyrophosphorylase family protein